MLSQIRYLRRSKVRTEGPLETGFDPGAWIEVVAKSVADEIEAQHRQHHRNRRK